MRLRNRAAKVLQASEYGEQIIGDPEQYQGKWCEKFGGKRLCIEVGTGKGMFLSEMAQKHPSTLFVGIELYASVLLTAAKRVRSLALPNVKLIAGDVRDLLNLFEACEVDSIFINFVDPWPKNKHAKRRLTHPNFLRCYEQVLEERGVIELKTDNEALFDYSLNQFADSGYLLRGITFDLHTSTYEPDNVWTEYETRYASQGLHIFRCQAVIRKDRLIRNEFDQLQADIGVLQSKGGDSR
ncbi:MAG: tRNA (guanine-N7)-methyltransferase [Bacilli bacterium]|nr:tRNA (guanine-N7)-methyltransferase [Bacilli bacterium]